MDRNITPIDTRHEAIKVLRDELSLHGFTRDSEPREVSQSILVSAAGRMVRRLVNLGDISFANEFLIESGCEQTHERWLMACAEDMVCAPSPRPSEIACQRAGWYAGGFVQEALDMLDSASEIERDRHVDEQIKQAKETA